MGVKSGGKTLHSISGMTINDLVELLKGYAKQHGTNRPIVVVDCNNLLYIFSQAKNAVVEAVVNHLIKFANHGIIMVPVVDGVRPMCKQATNERIAEKEKKRIKAFQLRKDLRLLKQRLINERLDEAMRSALEEQIKSLERKFKTSETKSRISLPEQFADDLENELEELGAHTPNDQYGYVEKVVVGQFQADSYMAGSIVSRKALMSMTTDTDIPIIAGDCCMSISGFTKNRYTITCVCASNLKNAMSFLPDESKATFSPAEFPFFDGVMHHRLRALIMLILGCDVYKCGMKGVGAKKLADFMEKIRLSGVANDEGCYMRLFDKFKKTNNLTDEVIHTYIDALLYEPTNPMGAADDQHSRTKCTYLFGPPTQLPKYLEEFSVDENFHNSSIVPGPTISKCKGVGSRSHFFLTSEGGGKCTKCEEVVCKACQDVIESKTYCLACFTVESIVPLPGSVGSKPISEMRKDLKDVYNFDDVDSLDSDEVEDVFEMMGFMRTYRKLEDTVPFPLYETSELDSDTTSKWEQIMEIDFKEGGAFLAEPQLNPRNIPGVLSLFASFVKFEPGKKTQWAKDAAVYDALPAIFVNFAENSRVDSGYRLLMRCIRHAFDSKTPTLDTNTAMLISHNDDIGIHLYAVIPASMEKRVYQTGIVATSKDLLCCKCTCQCGSQNSQRIVCVHNIPLLMLLTLLLFDGLAEHMLLELAACMNAEFWDKSVWSEQEVSCMKGSIITLMEAAGEPVGKHHKESSMDDLLSLFVVGTEKRKTWKQRIRTPPKPSELCPIYQVQFLSSAKRAVCATKRNIEEAKDNVRREPQHIVTNATTTDSMSNADNTDNPTGLLLFKPDYHRVTLLMDAAGCESVEEMNFVGFRLLETRSNEQATKRNRREHTALATKMLNDWKELKSLAKKRSIREIATKSNNLPRKKCPKVTRAKQMPGIQPPTRGMLRRPNQKLPMTHRKEKKRRVSICCAKCNNNNVNSPNIKFHCIPKLPPPLKSKKPSRAAIIKHQGRILLHRESMDRVCGNRDCNTKKYICEEHTFEIITKTSKLQYNNEQLTRAYRLTVPSAIGTRSASSNAKGVSKGIGCDRAMRKIIDEANKQIVDPSFHVEAIELNATLAKLEAEECRSLREKVRNLEMQHIVKDAQLELATASAIESNKMIQLMSEQQNNLTDIPINASLLHASGIEVTQGNAHSVMKEGRPFFHCNVVGSKKHPRHFAAQDEPKIWLGMSDKEVKRRTGFPNEKTLLSYIFVVCNGEAETIKRRLTSLTWYEEWFLHFEFIWGRSLTRFVDLQATYGVYDRDLRKVVSAKYDIEFRALQSWPKYATFVEDALLRKEKWNVKYKGLRPVMWDMTNISAYEFTDADLQRLTYNQYYGENCFKGGIHTQLCGWHGVEDLWLGAVSDSDYNRRAGYLDKQTEFQSKDIFNGEVIPFLNIYDKGYRAKMAALRNGKQRVLQPDWAKSDEKFGRIQTIASASVASDRGGNERSVNVSKRAGFISRGFRQNMCPVNFNLSWRTWAFQSNFMFKPVL